jgi:hypothetical protein
MNTTDAGGRTLTRQLAEGRGQVRIGGSTHLGLARRGSRARRSGLSLIAVMMER